MPAARALCARGWRAGPAARGARCWRRCQVSPPGPAPSGGRRAQGRFRGEQLPRGGGVGAGCHEGRVAGSPGRWRRCSHGLWVSRGCAGWSRALRPWARVSACGAAPSPRPPGALGGSAAAPGGHRRASLARSFSARLGWPGGAARVTRLASRRPPAKGRYRAGGSFHTTPSKLPGRLGAYSLPGWHRCPRRRGLCTAARRAEWAEGLRGVSLPVGSAQPRGYRVLGHGGGCRSLPAALAMAGAHAFLFSG